MPCARATASARLRASMPAAGQVSALERELAEHDAGPERRETTVDEGGAEDPAAHRPDHMPGSDARRVQARSLAGRARYAGVRRIVPRPATRRSMPSATVSGASAP